ncbi:MAG: heavy metal translocating P-type ATPase [Cognatishimia sp.]
MATTDHVTLSIQGMSCASCVGRVDKALAASEGVAEVSVNLATETATIQYQPNITSPAMLAKVADAAGYPATISDLSDRKEQAERQQRKTAEAQALRRQLLIAALLALPVFLLEMGGHALPAFHAFIGQTIGHKASWLIQFVLTSAVLLGPGRLFYTKGFAALKKAAPDMNSLVALGTGAAYAYSVIATFLPGWLPSQVLAVYYEAAAVIVVLILLGRYLEARAKGRTGAAIQKLLRLQVRTARIECQGEIETIDIDALQVGDIVVVRPGERIAVDGQVIDGESHVDESMITGEPVPNLKTLGEPVTGGTINGAGSFKFQATRVGADTTLSQIVRMVEEAQSAKLPIQGIVDRVTLWFVPAVMLAATLTVLVWLIFGPDPALTFALVAGVSVLIIACPCAMGLATPTSIMVGTGRAAELGVLFRKGDALQSLSSVDVIAFDKTGTLTVGRPELTALHVAEGFDQDALLASIAAVENLSEHPIAAGILRAAKAQNLTLPKVSDFISVTGYGAQAIVNGQKITVGAQRYMAQENIDLDVFADRASQLAAQGQTSFFAAVDGEIAAVLGVSDPIKPESKAVMAALRSQGLTLAMITGDKPQTAQAIAAEIGIEKVFADVLPAGKTAALQELAVQGQKTAFVGDGINDAPALAQADVGIAIGTGTDVAIQSGDVVLMSGDLRGVVTALDISRRTLANIRQNLFWAFAYNTALIPVAAGVLYPAFGLLLSPVLAASAMALSSVFVLTNALRLRRVSNAMTSLDSQKAVQT